MPKKRKGNGTQGNERKRIHGVKISGYDAPDGLVKSCSVSLDIMSINPDQVKVGHQRNEEMDDCIAFIKKESVFESEEGNFEIFHSETTIKEETVEDDTPSSEINVNRDMNSDVRASTFHRESSDNVSQREGASATSPRRLEKRFQRKQKNLQRKPTHKRKCRKQFFSRSNRSSSKNNRGHSSVYNRVSLDQNGFSLGHVSGQTRKGYRTLSQVLTDCEFDDDDDEDEDLLFMLSIVPELRKIPEYLKFETKVGIINAIEMARQQSFLASL